MRRSIRACNLVIACLAFIIFTSLGAALSCQSLYEGHYTLHCPTENSCSSNVEIDSKNVEDAKSLQLGSTQLSSVKIPEPGESFIRNKSRKLFEATTNRSLPSPKKALDNAKNMCPTPSPKHLYPKKDFNRTELRDTTRCYETQIVEGENYYLVWRSGTTEGLTCIEKVRGEMISGGETHYAAPAGPLDYVIQIISSLIPI